MRDNVNTHVHCYADDAAIDAAKSALDHNIRVHVFDGRIWTFPQVHGSDYTEAVAEWAADAEGVEYHAPHPDRLPFGEGNERDAKIRTDHAAKAQWANYEVLPSGEWTIRMDPDERLERFDVDLSDLEPHRRYAPTIDFDGPPQPELPRLYQPRFWTFYMMDNAVPREEVPRDAPQDVFAGGVEVDQPDNRMQRLPGFRLRNDRSAYDDPYLEARVINLLVIGNAEKARSVMRTEDIDVPDEIRDEFNL